MDPVNHALYTFHDRSLGLPALSRTLTVFLLIHSSGEALWISPFFHALYTLHGNPEGLPTATHSGAGEGRSDSVGSGEGEDTGKGEDTGTVILSVCFLIRNGFRTQMSGKSFINWQIDTPDLTSSFKCETLERKC